MRFRNLPFGQRVIFALVLIFATSVLFAQSAGTGSIAGTIADGTGASVPGAQITLINQGTNQTRTAVTGGDGGYRFNLIEIGQYTVRISAMGFKTSEVTGVTVSVAETPVVNRVLEVGQQTEQVTITAEVETIQTATSTLGTTVTAQTISALPLSTRNFTQTLGLSAGVTVGVANGAALGRGTQNPSVNGSSPYQNNFQMDGVTINNAASQGDNADGGLYTGIAIANPDALQEFKVQTSTFDASYGRNPGANVNVVTKSGTNELHGNLFYYFRNEALNANSFFYNRDSPLSAQGVKQVLKQNQFGFTLGGPLKKDKLFLFGSYQGTRQRNGVDATGTTNAFLQPIPVGDRSRATFRQELGASMCTQNSGLTTLFNIVNVACDGSNISPVALNLLNVKLSDGSYYIPSSGTSTVVNRLYSTPAKWREDQYIINGDWIVSSKHTVSTRFMYSHNPDQIFLGGQLPGRTQNDLRTNMSAVLRLTSSLTPTVINQFRLSGQRIMNIGTDQVPYTPQQIGLKPMVPEQNQPPSMIIIGLANIGGGLNPAFSPTNQAQIADQVSFIRGNHTLRTGFEYERFHWPLTFGGLQRGFNVIGSFSDLLIGRAGCAPADFPAVCNPGNPGATNGTPFSNILSCLFCVRSSPNGIIHGYDQTNFGAFFQDDWRVSSKLTLNLGLRWEYFGMPSDRYGNLTNLRFEEFLSVPTPTSEAAARASRNGYVGYVVPSNYDAAAHGPLPDGVRKDPSKAPTANGIPKGMFGPRVGFAWQPFGNGKFVLRGGFGMFYDRLGWDRFGHAVQEGKPYADTISYSGPGATPFSLATPFVDRPLEFSPRWYNTSTLTGSGFNSPSYDYIGKALTRQYNLGIQYEFLPRWVLDLAFSGASSINQSNYSWNRNTALLATPGNPVNGITTNTIGNASARVKILGFQPAGFQGLGFNGVANYNSMQLTVRRQFSQGLAMQGAYTWSRNLSTLGAVGTANLNHPDFLGQQYGPVAFSRNHRFVWNYSWMIPFTSNLTGVSKKVLDGWQISGLTQIQSGNPLVFIDTRGGTIYGVGQDTSIQNGTSRAQMAPGATYSSIPTAGDWSNRLRGAWNPAAFAPPPVHPLSADAATDYGNSGVGIATGPGQANWDMSLTKNFAIREHHILMFRAEAFNAFNTPQFSNPVTQVNAGTFGTITSTSTSPRIMQFALKYTF